MCGEAGKPCPPEFDRVGDWWKDRRVGDRCGDEGEVVAEGFTAKSVDTERRSGESGALEPEEEEIDWDRLCKNSPLRIGLLGGEGAVRGVSYGSRTEVM